MPFFPPRTCPSKYIFPKPLADLSQQCHTCQQHGLCGTRCHWPQWEEFTAAEGEIFSKPRLKWMLLVEDCNAREQISLCTCSLGADHCRPRIKVTYMVCSFPTPKYSLWWLSIMDLSFLTGLISNRLGPAPRHCLVQSSQELERWKSSSNAKKQEDLPNKQGRKEGSRGYVRGMQTAVEKEK